MSRQCCGFEFDSFNELFLLTKKPVVVFLHYDKKQINPILCDECVRPRPSHYPKHLNPYVYSQGNLLYSRIGEHLQGFSVEFFQVPKPSSFPAKVGQVA
jgi:hypothetical protein